jgi:hypothetical protein
MSRGFLPTANVFELAGTPGSSVERGKLLN